MEREDKTPFSYSKLKGRIVEVYGSQAEFAKAYGISENVLSRKMRNKTRFTSDDIIRMTEMLDIDIADVGAYFFTR